MKTVQTICLQTINNCKQNIKATLDDLLKNNDNWKNLFKIQKET